MENELETLKQAVRLYSQDTGMEFGIEKMRHDDDNKKQETTHDGANRTTKSIKNHNAQRKRNLQMLGNIRSRQH